MKRLLTSLCLFLGLVVTLPAQIQFRHDAWQSILDAAGRDNKLVFLDCYASWCGPCKWMATNAFLDAEVSQFFNARFVNAKIDMEQGEGPRLSDQFGITAYPTLLFVNAQGEVVKTSVGALDATSLLALGQSMAPTVIAPVDPKPVDPAPVAGRNSYSDAERLDQMKMQYANGQSNRAFLVNFLLALKAAGESYTFVVERLKPGMVGAALLEKDNWRVFQAVFERLDSEQARYFLSHLPAFAAAFGSAPVTAKAVAMYSAPMRRAATDGNATAYEQARAAMLRSEIDRAAYHVLAVDLQVCQDRGDWGRYAQTACNFVAQNPNVESNTLNDLAWGFYQHIDDLSQLRQAMHWTNQACENDPNYPNLDTKAMLLMKLGRVKEAITYAELAIETAASTGEDATATKEALAELLMY